MFEWILRVTAACLVRFGRLVVWFYYSPVRIVGRGHIPRQGPVLLVANHANSLIDPVLVGLAARRRVSFLAKAPLFEVPVFGRLLHWLGMIPVFRPRDDPKQTKRSLGSLSRAAEELQRAGAVGIFPEGKTHDQQALAEVLGGAARLIQQAVAAGAEGLQVVPVGINFDDKRLFRSAVWIEVGEPFAAAEFLTAADSSGAARQVLTAEIASRLRAVMIHLDRAEFAPFLEDLEVLDPAMTRPGAAKVFSLQQRKSVADAINHYCHSRPELVARVGRALVAHRERLRRHGLRVGSALLNVPAPRRWAALLGNSLRLGFGLLPVAAGLVQNFVPWVVERLIVWCLPQAGHTTVALSRLAVGVPVFVGWYALTGWLLAGYFLPWVVGFWLCVTPFAGLFALRYLRSARSILADWWHELRMLPQRRLLTDFRATQEKLRRRVGSLSHAYAALRPPLPEKPQRWIARPAVRFALLSGAMLLAAGFFVVCAVRVGFTGRPLDAVVRPAPDYRSMESGRLATLLAGDEARLVRVIAALDGLERRVGELRAGFASGRHSYFNDADNDLISREMLTYLGARRELLELILNYRNYGTIGAPELRARAELLQLGAGCALYQTANRLVAALEGEPAARRRLNEGEPAWGIPAGMLEVVRRNLTNEANLTPLRAALAHYRGHAPQDATGWLADPARAEIHRRIMATVVAPPHDAGLLARLAREANELRSGMLYRGQSAMSRAVGSTRLRQRAEGPRVRPEQLAALRQRIRPGDILLERQDWFLSRAFMPGYWAHAALYVGTPEDLAALDLARDPWVAPHWEELTRAAARGDTHLVIEAVPEGVRITTLEHCLGVADSAAVLRPQRVAPADLRRAIARAFHHLGKEYDFEFDFFSADKLVCTELVQRAYADCPQLTFPVVRVMGRDTLPPTEMARKFARERLQPDRQLGLVLFLDGHARGKVAVEGGEDEFAKSCERPGMTWFSSLD